MLGDWSISSPGCNLGITSTTEHDTLGDWSIHLYTRQLFMLITDYV